MHQPQQAFANTYLASTPNLLISAQNPQLTSNAISPNKNALLTSTYDLSTAYATNTNRTSPFETTTSLAPNPFLQPFNSSNQGTINSILNSAQTNSYFALPQHITNTFQSQLQDRL